MPKAPDQELLLLANQVKKRREALGIQQMSFAEEIGISNKTLHGIEAGRQWPSMPIYIKLCRRLEYGSIPLIT
jgi:DNA-binding XRE family transcriptional regulator